MLTIALSTLRTRWVSFVGCFFALFLGAGLIAVTGQVLASTVTTADRAPQRYAAAPVVVVPGELTGLPPIAGQPSRPAEPRGLPAVLAAEFPDAVIDRVFPAALAGGPPATGRPWSAARAAPHQLTAGRPPAVDGEIAASVSARQGVTLGERVRIVTAGGAQTYTVVGLTSAGPQDTLFFTDARAAALSPRIDALALWQPADAVRAVVGDRGQILTGQDRALADPTRHDDDRARNNANTIAGIAGGFAAFVAIFVVSSTFAFTVVQRLREFALLRTVGATRRQVRRMVLAEAGAVAVVASALGAVVGPLATGWALDGLISHGMAPAWTVVSHSAVPALVAFPAGVLVALLGAAAAAWRASRVAPVEAMRQAAAETRPMTPVRWLLGVAALLGGIISMAVNAGFDPESAAKNKTAMPIVMLLVAGVSLLAPVVVRPVTRVLARPLERLRGATGMVVAGSALTSARQTAAAAGPVLVMVALAVSLLGGAATGDAADTTRQTAPVRAEYLVLPTTDAGLDRELVGRLRTIPGVDVATSTPTSVYTAEGQDTVLIQRPVEVVEPGTFPSAVRIALAEGSFSALDEHGIVVSADWERGLGESLRLRRADGSATTLTVVGVLAAGASADAYIAPPAVDPPAALPSVAYVKLHDGAPGAAVEEALRGATEGHNAQVVSRSVWADSLAAHRGSASRLGLLAVLGVILAYTAIALVNIALMAAAQRAPERRALRLAGARQSQVLRFVAAESLLVVAIGVVLATATAALALTGQWAALVRVVGPLPIHVPWLAAAAAVAGCALLAVPASILAAAITDRGGRPRTGAR
ncbi:FtsX-like permease family protein [Amycolatopsis viridis]|uniref:ABC transport system permease protein n=1 Tax=Amycolatopsis viridis TaxID=185678 RepID=A0ABX0SQJ9_9PSEU|nr:FtsX-like permease family protein [Amycolatopsis viridis]NIH79231.1 putative ABC transport system permease protein [Amycolatopsis viridis]